MVVTSPDNNVQIKVSGGPAIGCEVTVRGREAFAILTAGLDIQGEDPIGPDLSVFSVEHRIIDETWHPVTGKVRAARNHANESIIHLREKKVTARFLDLVVRAYDDGIAFRYVLPKKDGVDAVVITGERTTFRFPADADCWYADYGHFDSSQEKAFLPGKLSSITAESLVGMPLLIKLQPDLYAAFTEADVTHWAGMRFSAAASQESAYAVALSLRLAQHVVGRPQVETTLPAQTPWRVALIARHPGEMIASTLIENLNSPSVLADTSWIKPGMASWNWWSGSSAQETDSIKRYIQLSADMGWPYALIDAGWYPHPTQLNADITKVVPSLDMDEVRRFAKEKGVGLWLWLHWSDVHRDDAYKEAFPLYHAWGIAGVKIDFMDREDQFMVDWYHTIFQATAENHLMLDFHGAYKPTGARRTWPQFITQEGVMGNEYNRTGHEETARHNVTLPYTRMLLGPMDYTPGGFLNVTPAAFRPLDHSPTVPNTRAQELAKFVVFESPLQCACDDPDHYRDQPGADFLKLIKASWDDVRFLSGEVGESIVLARQSGAEWFVGGMTNEVGRRVDVPLDFLPPDQGYTATIWRDAPDADVHPERLVREERVVNPGDSLPVIMAPTGGFVMHLVPR